MKTQQKIFGCLPDGRQVIQYSLENDTGLSIGLITFGAALTFMRMPDAEGNTENIVLGFDTLEPYLDNPHYLGATVGRCANRIANGRFKINDETVRLTVNNAPHHLHGGEKGLSRVVWQAHPFENPGGCGIRFTYQSKDKEDHYPGNLDLSVTYRLTSSDELVIEYSATTDKTTPINLTNHAYWNLNGAGKGSVLDHLLKLNCDQYLPVGESLIPTGEYCQVKNTPMDFTLEKSVGRDLAQLSGGYDHCFIVIDRCCADNRDLVFSARLRDPCSHREMEVFTTMPGIQLYTGNFLDGINGSAGRMYRKHDAICLETQQLPDAVNQATFPSPLIHPGEVYESMTLHRFSIWNG